MRADLLLKQNILAMLHARGHTQKSLAQWCRRSEGWLSKILDTRSTDDSRNLPMKYWDRVADFFGVATYQLLQPGISPLTERRKSGERRTGRDRRVSHAIGGTIPGRGSPETIVAALAPDELELVRKYRRSSGEARGHLQIAADVAGEPRTGAPKTTIRRASRETRDRSDDAVRVSR